MIVFAVRHGTKWSAVQRHSATLRGSPQTPPANLLDIPNALQPCQESLHCSQRTAKSAAKPLTTTVHRSSENTAPPNMFVVRHGTKWSAVQRHSATLRGSLRTPPANPLDIPNALQECQESLHCSQRTAKSAAEPLDMTIQREQ